MPASPGSPPLTDAGTTWEAKRMISFSLGSSSEGLLVYKHKLSKLNLLLFFPNVTDSASGRTRSPGIITNLLLFF